MKKVGVCSNSNSKAQNVLYMKCNARGQFFVRLTCWYFSTSFYLIHRWSHKISRVYSACVGRLSLNSIEPLSQDMENAINVHDAMCGNQESCSRST